MTWKHLLWKDLRTIQSLFLSIVIGIVAINVMLCLTRPGWQTGETRTFFVAFWYLMPNLFAFGAPAMLVGTEQDNGTLGWLRTLPIRWQRIADSKLIVATISLATTWILSTVCLLAATALLDLKVDLWTLKSADLAWSLFAIFFSFLLLNCGFITIYLFRTPIAGLFATMPAMLFLSWWIAVASESFDPGTQMVMGFALLLVMFSGGRLLARRRLCGPQWDGLTNRISNKSVSAYHPPVTVRSDRPGPTRALLWQAYRQTFWPCAGLLGLALFSLACLSLSLVPNPGRIWYGGAFNFVIGLGRLVLFFVPCWLGVRVFYSENVSNRRAFFADRGIGAGAVWWTRMLIPALCLLLFIAVAVAVSIVNGGPDSPWRAIGFASSVGIASMVIPFMFGVLSGQWVRRPLLAYLTAPVLVVLASVAIIPIFTYYIGYTPSRSSFFMWFVGSTGIVLLIGSRLVTARWLRDSVDWIYHTQLVGICTVAIALPIVMLFGWRFWTVPPAMPDWRAKMVAENIPQQAIATATGRRERDWRINPVARDLPYFETRYRQSNSAERELSVRLRDELSSDNIGDHVTWTELAMLIQILPNRIHTPNQEWPVNPTELGDRALAVKVLLKWATQIRTRTVVGEVSLEELDHIAERAEGLAISYLKQLVDLAGPIPELKPLVDAIPNSKLRSDSRRIALIAAWRAYNEENWQIEPSFGWIAASKPQFGSERKRIKTALVPLDRTRADRFVDRAVLLLLDQLDRIAPLNYESAEFLKQERLFSEAGEPDVRFGFRWTRTNEWKIDQLRRQFANVDGQ